MSAMSPRDYLVPPVGSPIALAPREAPYVLGRDESCDVLISSPNVSRRHCEVVVREDGRVTVRDLGARNGTFVNGAAVAGEHALAEGDLVGFGDFNATYHRLAPGEDESALARRVRGDRTTPPMISLPSPAGGLSGDLALYPPAQLLLQLTRSQATGQLVIENGRVVHELAFKKGNPADTILFERIAEMQRGKFRFEPAKGGSKTETRRL